MLLAAFTFPVLAACASEAHAPESIEDGSAECLSSLPEAVRVPGGAFTMGSDALYPEEGPPTRVEVDSFWMDSHEITNRMFEQFVQETGYRTVAEEPVDPESFGVPIADIPPDMLEPGSAVFGRPKRPSNRYTDWWSYVPGANWRFPYGPTGPRAQAAEPVVHLTYRDMQAYARWASGRLPTEAQWEYAATAGAAKSAEQPTPRAANTWQGVFPVSNEESDGFEGIAPVGCYPANAFGLYDMVGNVWEVTADIYRPRHDLPDLALPSDAPEFDALLPTNAYRVMKGGSYLCARNYCQRYRPESRQARDPGLGASNVGFRLVYDTKPNEKR